MSKIKKLKGSYKSSVTIEVESNSPIDARTIWKSWEEIADIDNWPQLNGKPYCYKGLVAYIGNDVYVLEDTDNWGTIKGWSKLQKETDVSQDLSEISNTLNSMESDFNDLEERVVTLEDITTWKDI